MRTVVDENTIQISATFGGAVIDLQSQGSGTMQIHRTGVVTGGSIFNIPGARLRIGQPIVFTGTALATIGLNANQIYFVRESGLGSDHAFTISTDARQGAPIEVGLSDITLGETLGVTVSYPFHGVPGFQDTATITIVDNDFAAGTFGFDVNALTVNEDSGTASVTIKRLAGESGAASLTASTGGGSATAGTDYVNISQTISFAAGETEKTFTVQLLDDTGEDEPDREFDIVRSDRIEHGRVGRERGDGDRIETLYGQLTLTINDDDPEGGVPSGGSDTTLSTASGASNPIRTVAQDSNNNLVVAGEFSVYANVSRSRIARITSAGALDTGFNPGTGANNTINHITIDGTAGANQEDRDRWPIHPVQWHQYQSHRAIECGRDL